MWFSAAQRLKSRSWQGAPEARILKRRSVRLWVLLFNYYPLVAGLTDPIITVSEADGCAILPSAITDGLPTEKAVIVVPPVMHQLVLLWIILLTLVLGSHALWPFPDQRRRRSPLPLAPFLLPGVPCKGPHVLFVFHIHGPSVRLLGFLDRELRVTEECGVFMPQNALCRIEKRPSPRYYVYHDSWNKGTQERALWWVRCPRACHGLTTLGFRLKYCFKNK